MEYGPLTKAALGEKVPANPPDYFHPTSVSGPPLSLTNMPRSWLKPGFAVQRSALPPSTAVVLAVGESVVLKCAASIACQLTPSDPVNVYCEVVTVKLAPTPVGKASAKTLVRQ